MTWRNLKEREISEENSRERERERERERAHSGRRLRSAVTEGALSVHNCSEGNQGRHRKQMRESKTKI